MIKKYLLLIFIFSFLISVNYTYSIPFGCCINTGAGAFSICTTNLVNQTACCPTPESSFTEYYQSPQNPNGPTDFSDCTANFFFVDTDCGLLDECTIGCCCSASGGTVMPAARCTGTGQTFVEGAVNCDTACVIPQCNNNIDDDGNGCVDYSGGDQGCDSITDTTESGGSCSIQPSGCDDPLYEPRLSNLQITPKKGQKAFMLIWQDECSQNAVLYEISRCQGGSCTNFALVGTTIINSFNDISEELMFDTIYTYQVKAKYSPQTATPTIIGAASLGNIECYGRTTTELFCLNNSAYYCDANNKLIHQGTTCPSTQVCVISDNLPRCLNKEVCNYPSANPFGLYYTFEGCEIGRYCFYDRAHTTVNSCFSCNPSMACYDYKSEQACNSDNCNVGNCKWKPLSTEIGTGVCVSTVEYNCEWCDSSGTPAMENLRAFNEVFEECTKEKSTALSEGEFICYYSHGASKDCEDVICTDYDASQCSIAQITHNEYNNIINPSNDDCGIGICQYISDKCVKNADGDSNADCSNAICELDYFEPDTTLLPILNSQSVLYNLIVQIYDKISKDTPQSLRTSQDYLTYLCVEPCGAEGHPYDTSTTGSSIVISNLKAFDNTVSGRLLLTFNEGTNVLRYYSQDPSKNLGLVKKITIEVYSNTTGPIIVLNTISVSDAVKVLDKYYTQNLQPIIEVKFYEPAIVTFARLESIDSTHSINLEGNTELQTIVALTVPEQLQNKEYKFELNAKNDKEIYMDPPFSTRIVVDTIPPTLDITPSEGVVINKSLVDIKLQFNEEVTLDLVTLNLDDITRNFSTINNKLFTATLNLSDGNKDIEVQAKDYAGNSIEQSSSFVVDAQSDTITLASPRFGTAYNYSFTLIVETDNDAECRFELDTNFAFEAMTRFISTGGTVHTYPEFDRIEDGDTSTHILYVRCKNTHDAIISKPFNINVDISPPQLISAFAYPDPVAEIPANVELTVEADEPVICKYSETSTDFETMEGKFEGFEDFEFKLVNKQDITIESEGDYLYNVACMNKAELNSEAGEITFTVDLSLPMEIISHTTEFSGTKNVLLSVQTNKRAQCTYSIDETFREGGTIFGEPGYFHTAELTNLVDGKYTYFVRCKDLSLRELSDIVTIEFTVDTTIPTMLFVDDTSTLVNRGFGNKTCLSDRLRVKWLGQDLESGIREYSYALFRSSDRRQVFNFKQSFIENEWVWVENLSLQDNTKYYFDAKSKSKAELQSAPMSSDGVTVDASTCTSDITCGDGKINSAGEDCDRNASGIIFGSISSCTQFTNFVGGTLGCTSDCKLDTSGCTSIPTCGNNELDPGESCDGTAFGDIKKCTDFSTFSSGTLRCTSACQLDTTGCIEKPKCGNSAIDSGESCDGTNLGPLSGECIDYNPSTFTGGNLSCNNCKLDTTRCQGISGGRCGDSTINIGEQCDGTKFGDIQSCTDYDTFSGGVLKCVTCQLDTTGCIEKPKCGNGAINSGEACDGTNLGPLSDDECEEYSTDFKSGTLDCTSDCKLDTSDCEKANTCGNKRLNTGEACDGSIFANLSDLSCISYSPSFIGGNISCSNCRISTSSCRSNTTSLECRDTGSCKVNEVCSDNTDCESRYCRSGRCAEATCSDNIKNQDEGDVDCGGRCNKCSLDKSCKTNDDCQSNFCKFGFCKPLEICYDTKLSAGETGVDCGGVCPTKCSAGKSCDKDGDCEEGLKCVSSICKKCEANDKNCNSIPDEQEDTDGDGMPDGWEIENKLNPNDPKDGEIDSDDDGLTNYEEYQVSRTFGKGTNPNDEDTDKDGVSDKKELDKGTNPLDPEDFPRTKIGTVLLIIFGILVLVSGFGYLAYSAVMKRKEERFEIERPKLMPRITPPVRAPPGTIRTIGEDTRLREAIRRRDEQKKSEREGLFKAFGEEEQKPEVKELKEGAQPSIEKKEEPKMTREYKKEKKAAKPKKQETKEEVFEKLKAIAKEKRSKPKTK